MRPANKLEFPQAFYVLRDTRGEFYAYSTPDAGVRCTDAITHARKYFTLKGASVARSNLTKAYGKQSKPVLVRASFMIEEQT